MTLEQSPRRPVHVELSLSATEMYDVTQTSDDFHDGHLFVCRRGKIVGFLAKAWPVMLFGEDTTGELHLIAQGSSDKVGAEYPGLFEQATELAKEYGVEALKHF